jgi:hypothetical protein
MAVAERSRERLLAHGIAASGRVARDEAGFTVYALGELPDAFRVWDDPHVGTRCTCERFGAAFRAGDDYACEHILAVALSLAPMDEPELEPAAPGWLEVRRIV